MPLGCSCLAGSLISGYVLFCRCCALLLSLRNFRFVECSAAMSSSGSDHYNSLTTKELRALCDAAGKPRSGNKAALITRLLNMQRKAAKPGTTKMTGIAKKTAPKKYAFFGGCGGFGTLADMLEDTCGQEWLR